MRLFLHNRKFKLLVLLLTVSVVLFLLQVWQKEGRNRMATSLNTMYSDRLIPATELHHLSNLLHDRKNMLDSWLQNRQTSPPQETLASIDAKMDSILRAYRKTYLVEEENHHLPVFQSALKEYRDLEAGIIRTGQGQDNLQAFYDHARSELTMLIDVQLSVGEQLTRDQNDTLGAMSLANVLNNCCLFVLMMMITWLIHDFRTGLPVVRTDRIHLN